MPVRKAVRMMMEQMLVRMREEELRRGAERDRQVGEARRAARAARAAPRPGFRSARRLALVIGRR
jgi:hypothetical protein